MKNFLAVPTLNYLTVADDVPLRIFVGFFDTFRREGERVRARESVNSNSLAIRCTPWPGLAAWPPCRVRLTAQWSLRRFHV